MQGNSNLFKLIGIRVLPECDISLRKVLRTDTTYFLCNDYEDDGKGGVRLKQDAQSLSPMFFCKSNDWVGPKVNVSCIVGHNGDGKSSLIELIIRLVNNFAYLSGFLSDHAELKFIPGLHVKLFYLVDNCVCSVSCLGNKAELTVGKVTKSWDYTQDKKKQVKRTKRFLIENTDTSFLFYTLISNYSLYAYNSEEFKAETNTREAEESWITALFHKNDAYQTPIVLAPQRKKGVIDVNRQYFLSMQRLSELFFDCKFGKYRISNTEKAEGIIYSVERESKLIVKTIREFVSDFHRGAKNVINFSGSFNVRKKKGRYNLDLSNQTELQLSLEFWENFDRRFFDTGLIELANSNNTVMVTDSDTSGNLSIQTDLDKYLSVLKLRIKKHKNVSTARGNINDFLDRGGGGLTFMQFQRVFLVFEVYKQWLERLGEEGIRPFKADKMTVRDHAIWYLLYKTIRVIENYPDFMAGGLKDYEIPHYFFSEKVRNNNIHKWFNSIYNDIDNDKTHLTTKIRQTLNYLQNEGTASLLLKNDFKSEELKKMVSELGYSYFLDCEKYYKAIRDKSDTISELPPPIFDYDFVISHEDESLYSLSRMSSGERQLLNSASAVVYHLKNIANSKAQGIKIVYRNVNVILEEVELYFHPEYQRRFINYLLDQIEFAKLPPSMAINLLFVTHSPFILSDIPRQHVLFLKDGKMDRSMQEDTFGANIHTLLQNGFFLGSVPIGEFAKGKISEMFKTLNKSESLTSKELKQLSQEIPLVSEPLIRSQLMRLYSQRKSFENGEYIAKIEALENRIHELEKQLNDKN